MRKIMDGRRWREGDVEAEAGDSSFFPSSFRICLRIDEERRGLLDGSGPGAAPPSVPERVTVVAGSLVADPTAPGEILAERMFYALGS